MLSGVACADAPHTVGNIKLVVSAVGGAVPTAITETVECEMVLHSIRHRSTQADSAVPFDMSRGCVPNISGVQTGKYTLQITPISGPSGNIT